MTDPVAEVLSAVARSLATLGVRWYLFGAQAAILYGVARLSADVDVTVDLGLRTKRELIETLQGGGFELRVADPERFAATTQVLPFVHGASRMPLDVVLAGPGLEDEFFARAHERDLGGTRVPVIAPEDLVTMSDPGRTGRARPAGIAPRVTRCRARPGAC